MTGPAEDRHLSPFTGWTRAHWEATADALLAAVRPHATPGHGLIQLPGPTSRSGVRSDGLEGFARTFLLAAFRLARADVDGPLADLAERYAAGLDAGSRRGGPESWPGLHDVRQARVEAASIAIGLHETRHLIWDRLDQRVRDQLVDWLGGAVGPADYPRNNWVWFQNVVQAFLRSVGAHWSPADIERNLELHESWYLGDGWYTDGDAATRRSVDYYNGWALHFYPLWYHRMSGTEQSDPLAERYRDRLRAYLAHAELLVGGGGAPLYHGRSLTYRFAVTAPFWAGAAFDATPLRPGRTRRLASGVVRWFLDRGATDDAGLLPIGWRGPLEDIRQYYSGGGSPYWASKAFAGLVLPAEHPVWTAPEEAMAIERGDTLSDFPEPGWVLSGTAADGIVRVAAHGADHASGDPGPGADLTVYGRAAYSSHTAPDSGRDAEDSPTDSSVTLVDARGRLSHRRPVERVANGPGWAVSRHRAHWLRGTTTPFDPAYGNEFDLGPLVTVGALLSGPLEVRAVRVDPLPDADHTTAPWRLRIAGHRLADDAAPPAAHRTGAGVQLTRGDGLTSAVAALCGGLAPTGTCPTEGRNAFGRYSAVPAVQDGRPLRTATPYVALVALQGGGPDRLDPAYWPAVHTARAPDGIAVTVRWADGSASSLTLPDPATTPIDHPTSIPAGSATP